VEIFRRAHYLYNLPANDLPIGKTPVEVILRGKEATMNLRRFILVFGVLLLTLALALGGCAKKEEAASEHPADKTEAAAEHPQEHQASSDTAKAAEHPQQQ
jgi:preprotein translocase subunit SecG